MKRSLALILALLMSFTMAFADGNPNIDGGDGDLGDGDKTNNWFVGDDGVRITIVEEADGYIAAGPIDFTDAKPDNIEMYFAQKSKIEYSKGNPPSLGTVKYDYVEPLAPIPPIISASGSSNIQAVKDYFSLSGTIQDIALKTDMKYTDLISGKYVILLEPIAYFMFEGRMCEMTATEAALYDQAYSGNLKKNMGYLTHQNLPLSMFLERPDLGYPAWSGATSGIRANSDIISSLGLGTVRFTEGACCAHSPDCVCIVKNKPPNECNCSKEHPDLPCDPSTPGCDCFEEGTGTPSIPPSDYEYHTDTEVITSFYLYDQSGSKDGVNPDMGGRVSATINGKTYTKQYVIPPNESTLVWFKWKTPKEPGVVNIDISVSGGGAAQKTRLTAKVSKLVENTPPDPKPQDEKERGWETPRVPGETSSPRLTWGEWIPRWHENWVWVPNLVWEGESCDSGCAENCSGGHGGWADYGQMEDHGWWEYDYKSYYAKLQTKIDVKPDDLCPTATKKFEEWTMKSGYGVNVNAQGYIETDGYSIDYTPPQNCQAIFPEFKYKDYNRILEYTSKFGTSHFQFYVNKYSLKGARSHYTPLWFPDNDKFEPYVQVFDAWCPAGELKVYGSDYVNIMGDMYDDWNISPVKNG